MDTGTWGLYYNYTWWGNAIQTAPSVIGKPDFFGSQFEMLTSQQPNQVVNGDFSTDSDWNLRNVWVISNGVCSLTPPNSDYLSQANVITANKFYKLSFDIVVNSGSLEPQFFDSGFQTIGTYSATQTVVVYFQSTSSGTLYFKPNSFDGSIDNVSVQLVRADNVEAVKCLADWIHETQILDV